MSNGQKFFASLIVVLLLANLAATAFIGYQLYSMESRQAAAQQAAEVRQQAAADALSELASDAIQDLEVYQDAAYGNSLVDRISEQQLLATETGNALLVKVIAALALTLK